MEFEDDCVVWSSKRTMEHWLWCVGHLIEAFGIFWCSTAWYILILEFHMSKSVWVCICTLKSLFSRESSEFRPSSHDIWRIFKLRCWRFVFMCFCQVNFWSRYRPRYFTSFSTRMCILLNVTGGQFARFVVNVIYEDLVWFFLIFHLPNQSCRKSKLCWSRSDASAASLSVARRAVSSAKLRNLLLLCCWFLVQQCILNIIRGPIHYLGVLRISLSCSLNRHCILLGSIFLRCMILTADSMDLAVCFWLYIKVQCARPYQRPGQYLETLLCKFVFYPSLQQFCWLFCVLARPWNDALWIQTER
jgi:hypothetical protein